MISTPDLTLYCAADDAHEDLLRSLERAAVAHVEAETGNYYGPATTLVDTTRSLPFVLRADPVGEVTLEEWDGNAWAAVNAGRFLVDGRTVFANDGGHWSRVRVTYEGGHTVNSFDPDAWDAPVDIQQAVRFLVAHWFENREAAVVAGTATEVPMAAQAILRSHRRAVV